MECEKFIFHLKRAIPYSLFFFFSFTAFFCLIVTLALELELDNVVGWGLESLDVTAASTINFNFICTPIVLLVITENFIAEECVLDLIKKIETDELTPGEYRRVCRLLVDMNLNSIWLSGQIVLIAVINVSVAVLLLFIPLYGLATVDDDAVILVTPASKVITILLAYSREIFMLLFILPSAIRINENAKLILRKIDLKCWDLGHQQEQEQEQPVSLSTEAEGSTGAAATVFTAGIKSSPHLADAEAAYVKLAVAVMSSPFHFRVFMLGHLDWASVRIRVLGLLVSGAIGIAKTVLEG